MEAYPVESCEGAFGSSRARFETVVAWLAGTEAAGGSHAELEQRLEQDSRRLFRQLLGGSPGPAGAAGGAVARGR